MLLTDQSRKEVCRELPCQPRILLHRHIFLLSYQSGYNSPARREGDERIWEHVEMACASDRDSRLSVTNALARHVQGYQAGRAGCVEGKTRATEVEEVGDSGRLHSVVCSCGLVHGHRVAITREMRLVFCRTAANEDAHLLSHDRVLRHAGAL